MFKTYTYDELDSVIFELKNNKAVIMPTDTVIGLIANNESLIYQIKNRPKKKKVILFVSNLDLLPDLTEDQKRFLDKFWPGQVTIVKNGISYRMPDDPALLYILDKTGPLYSSSANVSGHDPIHNTLDANREFNEAKFYYSLVLVEGKTKLEVPSTVVNIDDWNILREGCHAEEVKEFIKNIFDRSITKVRVLIDDDKFIEYSHFIAKYFYKQNYQFEFYRLTDDNLNYFCRQLVIDKSKGLIYTTNPLDWDYKANKQEYIRSGLIYDSKLAELSAMHDDANIAVFDLNSYDSNTILSLTNTYLNTVFEGGRHIPRVQTIIDYESSHTPSHNSFIKDEK